MKKLTSEEILEKYFSEKMLVIETKRENYDGIEIKLSYPIPLRWIDEVKAETGVDIVEFAPDEVELYNEVYFSKPEIIEIPGLEELLLNLKGASPIKRSLLKELIISQVKNA